MKKLQLILKGTAKQVLAGCPKGTCVIVISHHDIDGNERNDFEQWILNDAFTSSTKWQMSTARYGGNIVHKYSPLEIGEESYFDCFEEAYVI